MSTGSTPIAKSSLKSSGTTAITTTNDTAVVAIAADATSFFQNLQIFNGGSVAGQFSVDGGVTYHSFPASATVNFTDLFISGLPVMVRRIPAASNLSAVYVYVW